MKATMMRRQLILVLTAFSSHVFCVCRSSNVYGNETDRISLLGFKDAISLDPQQVFVSWNDSTHFCNWEGVLCRVKTPPLRVTSLNLANRGLVGHISPSLGNLTFLQYLSLEENALTGEIPPSLGHLPRLKTLRLHINKLQGSMPSFRNCSKLWLLDVSSNNLVGQFPSDLPPRLQGLRIWDNNLTGTIPASLANITTLILISFTDNHIKGNIPSVFGDLPSLKFLYASGNPLEGSFPKAILNISTLNEFGFVLNGLSGEVPTNLCISLPNIQRIELGGNFFLGHIPNSFTNASGLEVLDLSGNYFAGLVPSTFAKLSKLLELNLEDNELHAHSTEDWEFLDSLGNCSELQVLSLGLNYLTGNVPSSLGNLSTQLQHLYLTKNQLSGNFPSGIANLRNLIILAMAGNRFTGVIPEWVGTLKTLQILRVETNLFTGFIPSSLSNLTQLGVLSISSNQFIGPIPPSFGNFPMLQSLDISSNNLHGSVPMEIFRMPAIIAINLSSNNLDGQLPTNIGSAKQLIKLALSSNKISGDIPTTLGDCESLEDIRLDSNIFIGSIPTSLGQITSLKLLNCSTNNLTGLIPVSLGNLQHIEKLDLSFNHLDGEVPTKGIFKNASAVRIDGNQGLCGGALELHIQACVVVSSSSTRHKEYLVLKVIIPIGSMVSLVVVIFGIYLWRRTHKSKSISLPSLAATFPKISFNDLSRATHGFSTSNLIGKGGYSSVYQGKLLDDQIEVAIKVFNLETRGSQNSFIAECNALRNMRHRNLVSILTVCSSIDSGGNDFKALVYEFMPRGDLHKLLYSARGCVGSSDLSPLTMTQRISIVVDVADALEYLHHNNHGTMVHCDLKPSNILLDDNMIAHVGDFGQTRFKDYSTMSSLGNPNSSSIGLVGTIGYAAPEYVWGGQISTAADVYSFGVVLLEIFLRRMPTNDIFKDGLTIVKFTEISLPDRVLEIVDPQLKQELELCQETPTKEKGVRALLCMLNVGLCCTKPSPGERINMQDVASEVHGIKDLYLRGN